MGEMMTERRLEQLEKVAPEMVYGIRYSDFGELCIEVNRARESEKRLAELLSELATLVEEWLGGAYSPDSFTTQPARKVLAAAWVEVDNG